MRLSGITDFDRVPLLEDPESNDVKVILVIYSLESFLFRRLNQCCRDQDTAVLNTLGPFAVALTKIINRVQANRTFDKIVGPVTCYSGIAMPRETIEEWKK